MLDSHLHILVHLSPARVDGWSDEEVVRRWGRLVPLRGKDRQPLPVSDTWVKQQLANPTFVEQARKRLANLGWFMKCSLRATATSSATRPAGLGLCDV